MQRLLSAVYPSLAHSIILITAAQVARKVPSKVYSDGAQAYKLALKDLHWIADTCTLTASTQME